MLDVKQWGEKQIEIKHDSYRLRTVLPAVHCEMTKRKKRKNYSSVVEISVLPMSSQFNLHKQVHYLWRLN